jgi:hypothetical protein
MNNQSENSEINISESTPEYQDFLKKNKRT